MATSRSKRAVTVYIPDRFADANLFDKLSAIAEEEDRSLNAIIVRILSEYVGSQAPKTKRAKKVKKAASFKKEDEDET